MEQGYKEVKLKKNVHFFILGLIAVAFFIIVFGHQWNAIIIPLMLSVLLYFYVKNDRILYNDCEVVLFFSPFPNKICLSWDQIVSVEVKYQQKLGRAGKHWNWYLIITYSLDNGKTESMKKLYYNYDGAGDFEEYYKTIKNIDV